jgi:hypothetical protein
MICHDACAKVPRALLYLLIIGLSLSGCAHLPLVGRKAPKTVPASAPETVPEFLPEAAPETTPAEKSDVKVVTPRPIHPKPPKVEIPDSTGAQEVTTTPHADPTPILSTDLPPEEKARLMDETERDLVKTKELLQALAKRNLSPSDEEKLRTAEALLRAAEEAGLRAEVREAASLARKAWLLALDLSGR